VEVVWRLLAAHFVHPLQNMLLQNGAVRAYVSIFSDIAKESI